VTLSSTSLLDGDYGGLLEFRTNDPRRSTIGVSLDLHVGEIAPDLFVVDASFKHLWNITGTVEVTLQFPLQYNPRDVVISTVELLDVIVADPDPVLVEDRNGDGVPELILQFDSMDFEKNLAPGPNPTVSIVGEIPDQTWFRGETTLRNLPPAILTLDGGEFLLVGESVTITWEPAAVEGAQTYDLYLSRDGGESWEVIVEGLGQPSYAWSVQGLPTGAARIRVYAADDVGPLGYDSSDLDFTIAAGLHPPLPVTTLRLDRDGSNALLTWSAPPHDPTHGPAEDYRILVSETPTGPFVAIDSTPETSYSAPLAGPTPFFYKVLAINATGEASN